MTPTEDVYVAAAVRLCKDEVVSLSRSADRARPPSRARPPKWFLHTGFGRIPFRLTMRIPNADQAIIAPEKLRDYLLNPAHRRGSAKARLLLACGYRTAL